MVRRATAVIALGASWLVGCTDRPAELGVTVDPLVWVEQQKLVASESGLHHLVGESVSVSGDTALVGAPNYPEFVSVFVRSGSTWVEQQKLVPSDGDASAFGISVSLSGDTAIVGTFADVGASLQQGSAYVFVRSGSTWIEQQKLVASDGGQFDFFGVSVSVSGDTAVVGADAGDGPSEDQGSAYVFVRSGSTWAEKQKLIAFDGETGDHFGGSVSVSDDTVLVGAWGDDVAPSSLAGSVYVFVRSGSIWTGQQKLTASDGAPGDLFGASVSLSGDTALVGAHQDTIGGALQQGSAHVFVRSGSTWTEQQKLTASDGAPEDFFGYGVSVSGDRAVIGAYGDSIGANAHQGSAYFFGRSGSTWTEQQKLLASDGSAEDAFGYAVSLDGDTAVIGAIKDEDAAKLDTGSAYAFRLLSEDGDACEADADCASGHCVDGVCCNSACDGQCEACDIPSSVGSCSPVPKGPAPAGKPACAGMGTCAGSCDGVSGACSYPDATTMCGTSCADGKVTSSACDGNGACVDGVAEDCPDNLACEGTSGCKPQCTEDGDCVSGSTCESEAGKCVSDAAGAAAEDEGGCGCRAVGSQGDAPSWWVGLAPVLALARRRAREKARVLVRDRA